jgi:hypothetical protein
MFRLAPGRGRDLRGGILAVALLAGGVAHAADWRPLFDGTLTGWRLWLGKPEASVNLAELPRQADGKYAGPVGWDRDPLGVARVVTADGQPAIRLSGEVFGLLESRENFGNYHLRLQFKWGEKKWPPREKRARDSGILYHIHSEPGVSWGTWPASHELQLQEHDCGDLYTLKTQITVRARRSPAPAGTPGAPTGFYTYDPAGEAFTFAEETPVNNRCIRAADLERPHGEWNTVELFCVGGDSSYAINGQVVMRLSEGRRRDAAGNWIPLTAGPIGLQSEGAEVFFRQIEVQSLDVLPAHHESN